MKRIPRSIELVEFLFCKTFDLVYRNIKSHTYCALKEFLIQYDKKYI